MNSVLVVLSVALAVAITVLVVLLMQRRQSVQAARDVQAEQQQLQAELQALQANSAAYETLKAQHQSLQRQLEDAQAQQQTLRAEHQTVLQAQARLEERLAAEQEKQAFSEESRKQLKQEFEQLANKVLEQRGQKLSDEHQKGLDGLLKPFQTQLQDFRRRVDQIHTDETRAQASLIEQLGQLKTLNQQMHDDALNLTQALKGQVKTQGNWGEMILERVLESSGLTRGREYETQVGLKDEAGQQRFPDAIIRLPEDKDVVVDAKVSLVAYERLSSASSEEERAQAMKEHLASLRAHIKGLDKKSYYDLPSIRSLDFVLLFIPIEGAFLAAMEQEPELYNEAFSQHIVLVSPTTLLVTLRTIQNIWRYEYQNQNAADIASRAGLICDQVSLLEESLKDVGGKLEKAHEAWEVTYKRLHKGRGNLLGQAHKLQALGAKSKRPLPPMHTEEEDEDTGDDLALENQDDS